MAQSTQTIKLKANTTGAGAVPSAGALAVAEVALNTVDKVLYSKAANGTVIIVGSGADSQNIATQLTVGNSTVNTAITAGQVKTANSTASVIHTLNSISTGNATLYSNLFSTGLIIANTLSNTVITATGTQVGNATFFATYNFSGITIANSTSNTALTIPTTTQYAATNVFLHANGSWVVAAGGAGSPGGVNTNIQFSNGSAFVGENAFSWDTSIDRLIVGNTTLTTSPSIKVANSTSNLTITIPTSVQASATNFYLNANGSWTTAPAQAVAIRQNFTASTGSNTFTVSGGYTTGQLDVFLNGVKMLVGTDVTAANGTGIQFVVNLANNDIVEVLGYSGVSLSSVGGGSDKQLVFNDGGVANGSANVILLKSNNTVVIGGTISGNPDLTERLRIADNANNVTELQIKNANTSNQAVSSVTMTSDSGTSTTNYLNIGINGSTYSNTSFADGPNDGYIETQNGHIWVMTTGANDIIFQTNGTSATGEVGRWKSGGGLNMKGIVLPPATPPANTLTFFAQTLAGRSMGGQIGPSGTSFPYQSSLGANRIQFMNVIDNTALPTAINFAVSNVLATTARAVATTNNFLSIRRTGVATNTTAGTSAELRSTQKTVFLGSSAGTGGFYLVIRAGVSTVAAQGRVFIGLSNTATTAVANVNPSTMVNQIGFSYDSAATQWSIVSANATVVNTVALGTGFSVATGNTQMCDFYIFAKPNSATCGYAIVDVISGNTVTGTYNSTNLPAVNTLLGWKVWVNNGSTAGVHAVDVAGVYLETDNSG